MRMKRSILFVSFGWFFIFCSCHQQKAEVELQSFEGKEQIDFLPYGIDSKLVFPKVTPRALLEVQHQLDSFDWKLIWRKYNDFNLEDWGELNPLEEIKAKHSADPLLTVSHDSLLLFKDTETNKFFGYRLQKREGINFLISTGDQAVDLETISFFSGVYFEN